MAHGSEAPATAREPHIRLLLETVFVTTAVVALLGGCRRISAPALWFLGPFVLTGGAVVPTLAHGGRLTDLGLRLGRVRHGALLLAASGVCMFALGSAALLVFKCLSLEPPAPVSIPEDGLLVWILFQFVYIALPEELFFRGYVLGNGLHLTHASTKAASRRKELIALIFSATVFAVSHVLVLGDRASGLTFFPGLIFAWLVVRVGSLFPAVLLHGAANIGYAMMLEATM